MRLAALCERTTLTGSVTSWFCDRSSFVPRGTWACMWKESDVKRYILWCKIETSTSEISQSLFLYSLALRPFPLGNRSEAQTSNVWHCRYTNSKSCTLSAELRVEILRFQILYIHNYDPVTLHSNIVLIFASVGEQVSCLDLCVRWIWLTRPV